MLTIIPLTGPLRWCESCPMSSDKQGSLVQAGQIALNSLKQHFDSVNIPKGLSFMILS